MTDTARAMIAEAGMADDARSARGEGTGARSSARAARTRARRRAAARAGGSACGQGAALQRARSRRCSATRAVRRVRDQGDARAGPRLETAPPSGRRSRAQNRLRNPDPVARAGATRGSRPSSPRTRTLPLATTTTRCTRSSIAAKPAAGGGRRSRPAPSSSSSRRSAMNAAAFGPTQSHRHHDLVAVLRDLERPSRGAHRRPGRSDWNVTHPGARILGDGRRVKRRRWRSTGRTRAAKASAAPVADHRRR